MRTRSFILTLLALLPAFGAANADDYTFRLRNSLGWQRTEVVEVTLPDGVSASGKTLKDASGQTVAYTASGQTLRFEAQVAAGSTAQYTLADGTATPPTKRTYAVLKLPSSRNDIAWENDMAAYRMYSSVLLKNDANTANGVDLWQKKKTVPVIDNIYAQSNYHNESEYGVDAYSVNGKTLGCAGIGACVDGHLVLHNPFDKCEIVENGLLRSEFVLTFNNVVISGKTYTKTLRIETTAGRMLNKATVSLTPADASNTGNVTLAIGIYTHDDMSSVTANGVNFTTTPGLIGRAEQNSEGSVQSGARFFEGVYVPGTTTETKIVDNHLCLLVDYQPGTELTYYFGGGWNVFPSGAYPTDDDWFDALTRFKAEVESPLARTSATTLPRKDEVLDALTQANSYWQTNNATHGDYFWNRAVYHIGNMEAYKVTGDETYRAFSEAWAERNNWKGATANNWNYTYGENNVLFGDCQVCFQIYADLYNLSPEERKIARAIEVMSYETSTTAVDYWWWVDGLFMVMPVMTKLYNITHDDIYLEKMHQYWQYANSIMYDEETGLYFRDAAYVYPAHKTSNGNKDFWARGDGWIFAAFAKILSELPSDHQYRSEYISYYQRMAATLKQHQQQEGYWTRSILDPDYAPGYETSGTALMTYAYAWGVNNGLLSEEDYGEVIERAWEYLSKTALQGSGLVGYVQPIGANAAPGTSVGAQSTADFGVGAFLMACSELYKYAGDNPAPREVRLSNAHLDNAYTVSLAFNVAVDATTAADMSHYTIDGKAVDGEVKVDGRNVTITLTDMLDYGRYTLQASGVTGADGGIMSQAGSHTMILTVPMYANQLITKVTASGYQTGNTPANAIDGNISTRWSHNGKGQWLQLELNEVTRVKAVDVAYYSGTIRKSYFDVQLSLDGKTFTDVLTGLETSGTTDEMERYAFTPEEARYVRLVCNGNSAGGDQWNSITEVRVVADTDDAGDAAFEGITIPENVYTDIVLPTSTKSGAVIRWTSSEPTVLTTDGFVSLPAKKTTVVLTAATTEHSKKYVVTVHPRDINNNLKLTHDHIDLTANTASGFKNNTYLTEDPELLNGVRSYTFFVKATPKSLDKMPRLFDFGENSGNSVFLRANPLAAGLKYNGGTTQLVNSNTQLTVGKEANVAVTFDASTHTTKVYVDGTLTATGTNIVKEPHDIYLHGANDRNYIGRTQWWDTNVAADNIDYQGTMDNLMFFDIALTEEELQTLPAIATKSNVITEEGAWCWFADPRAMHYTSADGTVNNSYIGYIDVHGAIKATQVDFNSGKSEEVLVRSNYQPDDHDNPTFLTLPDDRIMIFYSRHTDEPAFYYRISTKPGDITSLGEEKRLAVSANTTYPSPFIMSDDPDHIYLCWRGIGWHPTIARLTMPDSNDDVKFDWGPYQMVQSTGARPYAKYQSNGKDKIYVAYTTGHPDNEYPNWLYFNVININGGNPQLADLNGNVLSTIASGKFNVNKTSSYKSSYPATIVDAPTTYRDWVWQIALDKDENPVIAFTRITQDKNSHEYLGARWTGSTWTITDLANGGGRFHSSNTEYCYSGGMAIDPDNVNDYYLSIPTEGANGKIYELWKYTINDDGTVTDKEQLTSDSEKNNVRPFILPGSKDTPLRLAWMYGDYYYWLVNSTYPKGYPTAIRTDYEMPENVMPTPDAVAEQCWNKTVKATDSETLTVGSTSQKFTILLRAAIDKQTYEGQMLSMGNLTYGLDGKTVRPYVKIDGQTYSSQNVLGTSDSPTSYLGSNGEWTLVKLGAFLLAITYDGSSLTVYRNGIIDQRFDIAGLSLGDISLGGFAGQLISCKAYDEPLTQTQIRKDLNSDLLEGISMPQQTWSDIVLPTKGFVGADITWTSDNSDVLAADGLVKQPETATMVTLTAKAGDEQKEFVVTVMPRDIKQNLMLNYEFEEADVYEADGQKMVKDHSANGRDARLMGNAKVDGTLNLSQNTASGFSTNGYAIAPQHVLDSLRSYTFLLECAPQSLSSQPRLYDFGSGSSNSVFLRASALAAGLKLGGAATKLVSASKALAKGESQKIAVSYNAANKQTTIYLNGEQIAQGTAVTDEPYQVAQVAADARNYIGRTQWWDDSNVASSNVDYCGTLDNFCLYNACLTQKEICEVQDITIEPVTYPENIVNGGFEATYTVLDGSGVDSDRAIYVPEGWSVDYANGNRYDITALKDGNLYYSFFAAKARPTDGGDQSYWVRQKFGTSTITLYQLICPKAGTYTLTAQVWKSGLGGNAFVIIEEASGKQYQLTPDNNAEAWQTVTHDFVSDGVSPTRISVQATHTADGNEKIIGFDNVTMTVTTDGIANVEDADTSHSAIYDLQGRKLQKARQGVYIMRNTSKNNATRRNAVKFIAR